MSPDDELVLVLKPPQRPLLAFCAGVSGVCIAVGFVLAFMPVAHFLVWLALGFAGVLGLACVGYLLPGNSALILTADGFTILFASRAASYRWSEVDYFAVAERRIVAFRLLDTSEHVSAPTRQLTGFDGALPTRYGALPLELLAARLNECCQRFGEPTRPKTCAPSSDGSSGRASALSRGTLAD